METTVLIDSASTGSIRGVIKRSSFILLLLPLAMVAAFVTFGMWQMGDFWGNTKMAGFSLAMPASGEIDHRFDFPSVWQVSQIPRAVRFDPPMGTERSGLIYNAQKFWEMNNARGGHHTGDDLNGIGGMNTDLGDPVYSTADGLVLYVGEPSPGWGKTVVIAHKTLEGRILHSMYAHLNRIDAVPGALVSRGGKVGTVGTANGYYPAHLHFEIRASDGVDIGAGYAAIPLNRLDPMSIVNSLRNAADDDLAISPLRVALSK